MSEWELERNIKHVNKEVIDLHVKLVTMSVDINRLTQKVTELTQLVIENNSSVNVRITNNEEISDQNKEYHENLFRRVNEKLADQDERLLELEGANSPANYKPETKKVSER